MNKTQELFFNNVMSLMNIITHEGIIYTDKLVNNKLLAV